MQFSIKESPTKGSCDPLTQLTQLIDQIDPDQHHQLIEYAEFLASRYPAPVENDTAVAVPLLIPRPTEESVVAAIKRLSASYFMIDRSKMLHETAALMSQHVMQGRAAQEVIDDVELLFQRYYQKLCDHG